jgi:polysaccharide biosynthesis protein PslH
MKILQICKKFPYPLKDGESIAVTYLSKALADLDCEVTLLSMNTTKHYVDIDQLPSDFTHYKQIYTCTVDNRVKWHKAFKNLFSSESYHISRFVSEEFNEQLIGILKSNKFDVIQLETMYLTPYIDAIREHSDAIVSLRAHNIEFEIWERISENTKSPIKKLYLNYLTDKLRKYELKKLNDYDYLVAISDRDLFKFKTLGYKNGAMSSPVGLDLKLYNNYLSSTEKPKSLCFIGALDWMPNLDGLYWFLDNVWGEVIEKYPDAEFHIAGRHTPPELLTLRKKGVVVHGEVEDSKAFIIKYGAMVVPLFSGSGMRVKIIEGMALSKCIISTSIGMEGINVAHKHEILVANTKEEFVRVIDDIFAHPEKIQLIGKNALKYVQKTYDYKKIAHDLLLKYKFILNRYKKAKA